MCGFERLWISIPVHAKAAPAWLFQVAWGLGSAGNSNCGSSDEWWVGSTMLSGPLGSTTGKGPPPPITLQLSP